MLDFDAEWKRLQAERSKPDDIARWNKRSARYDTKDARNLYAEEFLALARIKPGETVFDMGCGTGALAMPLAASGHRVIAADFSDGMLEKLHENMGLRGVTKLGLEAFDEQTPYEEAASENGATEAAKASLARKMATSGNPASTTSATPPAPVAAPATSTSGVAPVLMSWEDDWSAYGLRENMVDVAFASRSIAVADLRPALAKLSRIARRRCCVTMATGTSPRVDPAILEAIDVPVSPSRDFVYAFGLLAQAGFEPEVRYIHSPRKDTFTSPEDALEDFSAMIAIGSPALSAAEAEAARSRLRAWLDAHLVDNPEAGKPDKKGLPQGALTLDRVRIIPWAFISWDAKAATL